MSHVVRVRRALLAVLCVAVVAGCVAAAPPRPGQRWLAPAEFDVAYKPGATLGCGFGQNHERCGGSQTLDVVRRTAGQARGTIVFVHGGGFAGGDKSLREEVGPILRQTRFGWDVVLVNYRLVSPGRNLFPTAVADVAAAVSWVRTSGPARGLAVSRVVVAGHSAGATLASLIGTGWNSGRSEYRGAGRVDGYVAISGIQDFDLDDTGRFWAWFWLRSRADARPASPVSWLDAADPPGWFIHGADDTVVSPRHSERMRTVARAGRFAQLVHVDVVDRDSTGAPFPAVLRGHTPSGGAQMGDLDAFLASL